MYFSRLLDWRVVTGLIIAFATTTMSQQIVSAQDDDTLVVDNVFTLEINGVANEETFATESACEKEGCDKQGCDGTACETEVCDSKVDTDTVTEESQTKTTSSKSDRVAATHRQTDIIKVLVDDLPKLALKTFCLTSTGDLLAACGGDASGDVRHFSPTGEFIASWEIPFAPEAINIGSDGKVYAAGEGKLVRFTLDGEIVNEGVHPFGEVTEERREELRKEVIASHKSQREWMTEYLEDLESQIETIEERLGIEEEAEVTEDAEAHEAAQEVASEEDEIEESPAEIAKRQRDEVMLKSLVSQQEMYQRMVDQQGEEELTEEQIEQRVKSSLAYKMKVASISEADGEVFIATGATKGYGFSVWRMNRRFEASEQIVNQLSGCCGQMDVQACDGGIYVAENSRHQVRCFDRTGKEVCSWGSGAREGLTGFGGCCNPMNVAFGPEKSVYTAESETGRIKQYSPDGKLLGLVGKADLVPGCKKVSIAVGPAGDRVYMLDITRNHILMLERLSEEDQLAYYERELSKGYPEPDGAFATFFRTMGKAMAGSH